MTPKVKERMILIAADLIRRYPKAALKTPYEPIRIIQPMSRDPFDPTAEDLQAFMADLPFVESITVFEWLDESGAYPHVVPGLKIECRSAAETGFY